MTDKPPVLFDNALNNAVDKIKNFGALLGKEIVLVRTLRGQLRVLLPERKEQMDSLKLEEFTQEFSENLGKYGVSPDSAVLYASDLIQGREVFDSSDRRLIDKEDNLKIWLLDRQIMGLDWMRAPLERQPKNPRVTFFGIKGGVGSSTALSIWAWNLAARYEKKILILDLDLESPGVSSNLLPDESFPKYGIVDWFVEEGVGQAAAVEDDMIGNSPVARDLGGEIRIVPAFGQVTRDYDYLSKLNRCYTGSSRDINMSWADRMQKMVQHMEDKENPDLVILDSRAGLHDIAALTVTRMAADVFLFAVDSIQTWKAYALLFKNLKNHPNVGDLRDKLQIVAGMVPETEQDKHMERFLESSWDLFRENLYDEAKAQDKDAFTFDLRATEAPHYPLPVYWSRTLQEFDPLRDNSIFGNTRAEKAMEDFMKGAKKLVFGGE